MNGLQLIIRRPRRSLILDDVPPTVAKQLPVQPAAEKPAVEPARPAPKKKENDTATEN